MRRLRTTGVLPVALIRPHQISRRVVAVTVLSVLLSSAPNPTAQTSASTPPASDVLGVHNVGGRGCGACHAPHADSSSAAGVPGGTGLWQPLSSRVTQQTVRFGQDGRSVEVDSARLVTPGAEVMGVVLCLSCHDGNVTPQNMLATESYEQKVGLRELPGRVRSVLDQDWTLRDVVDHPFGATATIETGNGLEFRDGKFVVIRGSAYAQFVANYGWPSLAPRDYSTPYGVDHQGRPYLVCTTCHNQHAMNIYPSRQASPVAGDRGTGNYATFFFVNGPYNPNRSSVVDRSNTTSSAQFCRQCHFRFSNEANNANNIKTLF
ncbi:MAG TPA: hypothetical protein VMT53_02910 [Terriglobales bacterium]|nr:hypothetical protein [Terriglobales bacterium]